MTLWGVFLGSHFSRKTLLRKEEENGCSSDAVLHVVDIFFLPPNQPSDFKCSKQPIIYITSSVEALEHVYGGELQTGFEIELICGESWRT